MLRNPLSGIRGTNETLFGADRPALTLKYGSSGCPLEFRATVPTNNQVFQLHLLLSHEACLDTKPHQKSVQAADE